MRISLHPSLCMRPKGLPPSSPLHYMQWTATEGNILNLLVTSPPKKETLCVHRVVLTLTDLVIYRAHNDMAFTAYCVYNQSTSWHPPTISSCFSMLQKANTELPQCPSHIQYYPLNGVTSKPLHALPPTKDLSPSTALSIKTRAPQHSIRAWAKMDMSCNS